MWDETAWQEVVEQSDAFEFDWYGVDRLGQVAAFSTYGRGVIPIVVKRNREAYNILEQLVMALPNRTVARLVFGGGGQFDDWLAYSYRGLYGYDYQDAHRTTRLGQYDLITVPTEPIHLAELNLPDHIIAVVPTIDVVFGTDAALGFALFPG